jgi:cytochrome P450
METKIETGQTMKHIPTGPKGNIVLGSLPDFQKDRLGFLDKTVNQYGDVSRVRFAHMSFYILNHPDLVEEVLQTKNKYFVKNVTEEVWFVLLGNGLLISEGEFWRRQRRLMQPSFHRKHIADYGRIMVEYTERLLSGWRNGEERDIHADMMRVTLEVVAKTLFGSDVAGEAKEVGDALEVLLGEFEKRMLTPIQIPMKIPTPNNLRFRRSVQALEIIIQEIIQERRAAGDPASKNDLLQLLLDARDEDGSGMTDKQLRDELMTLILAGHETTANTLSWTWYLLSQNPEVEERLICELATILDGRSPKFEDLPNLRYADQVIKESMRLYPPVWTLEGRRAIQDLEIGEYHVPRGTIMLLSPWLAHRDKRYFVEPERFNPARWTEAFSKSLPRYAYFPFGGGPRLCIGQSFATMEAVLILATVAQRFKLSLSPGQDVVPYPSITLRPSTLKMEISYR